MNKVTFLDFSNPLPKRSGGGATLHIGALYIVAALEKKGFEVDYRDYQTSKYCDSLKVDDMIEFAMEVSDVVLVSCMAYMLPLVVIFSERFKELFPNKILILGGPGPAGVAKELVGNFSSIDFVICGEGEETLPKLMEVLLANNGQHITVPGTVYKTDQIYSNAPVRINNLDELPLPAYHEVDMSQYSTFGIITGRGCVYRCKFCDVHGLWGEQYRRRSISKVLDEIELLVNNYGVTRFDIWDDTFIVSRKRVIEFIKGIHERQLNIHWNCFGRVNLIDEELLQMMSQAGCDEIFYGIESGSQSVLDKIDKQINFEDVNRVINMSLKYVRVSAHLIWGFPFEDYSDFFRTIYMYNYLQGKIRIGLGQLWPYPTSPLYIDCGADVVINNDQREFYKILPFPTSGTEDEVLIHNLVDKYPHIFTQYTIFKDERYKNKKQIMDRLIFLCDEK